MHLLDLSDQEIEKLSLWTRCQIDSHEITQWGIDADCMVAETARGLAIQLRQDVFGTRFAHKAPSSPWQHLKATVPIGVKNLVPKWLRKKFSIEYVEIPCFVLYTELADMTQGDDEVRPIRFPVLSAELERVREQVAARKELEVDTKA